MRHEADMRREIMGTRKHGMTALMLAIKEAETKAEAIPVHMHQGQTSTKQIKDKYETPTVMVYAGQINKITTICLTTE